MDRDHSQEWGQLGMGTSSGEEMHGQTHRPFQCSGYMEELVNTDKCCYVLLKEGICCVDF